MNTRLQSWGGIALGLVTCVMTACNPPASTESGDDRLKVVATVGMIADVAEEIGADRVSVTSLVGAGVDPHLYRPTITDVKLLDAADLVLYNGLHLEGRMGETLKTIGKRGTPVHAVAEEALHGTGKLLSDEEGQHDPHLWMDVAGWSAVAERIANVFAELDAKHAELYQQRSKVYLAKLQALDAYARETLASIPAERRVLVTAHDAFGYMARAYGIEVKAVQGISTESEAGLKEINNLVDFLVKRKVPAVFVESSLPTKAVEALIEGAASKGHVVRIGGELFSDAMGQANSYEGTYIGMVDHNVTTIARALGGKAPEKGLHGKLQNAHL
jgi:manganese/zinc/iron transport system substrate-binding protein